jgi:hypothetical protein
LLDLIWREVVYGLELKSIRENKMIDRYLLLISNDIFSLQMTFNNSIFIADTDTLEDDILPPLLLGLKDTNPVLVAATLR